jgi:uncharacterized protein YbjT (DUF2867 family)
VTGATGKIGGAVIQELRRQGALVRALVRTHDARSRALEAAGVEVHVGDLFDVASLTRAMSGASRAVYCPPFHPDAACAAEAFATAAGVARVAHLVSLSLWLASPHHPSPLTRHHWFADRRLSAVPGATHTVVAPGFFADNYLRLIGFAAQLGVLPSLTGDSTNAPPSNEDIARVMVGALLTPERWAGAHLRPTGPALLSTRDMAHILSAVLQRRVRRVELPLWLFLKAARLQGVTPFELSGFRHYVRDHQQGAFAHGAPTDHVQRVTGRAPESFATIAQRYAQRDDAQRTATRVARAWFDFLRTPLLPGVNLERFDRTIGAEAPPQARYAMEDAEWQHTRAAMAC